MGHDAPTMKVLEGEWWLPDNAETALHGRLFLVPGSRSELVLYGKYPTWGSAIDIALGVEASKHIPGAPALVGVTDADNGLTPITALNCAFRGAKMTRREPRESVTVTLAVPLVVLGIEVSGTDEPLLSGLEVELDVLGSWAGASPFELRHDTERRSVQLAARSEQQHATCRLPALGWDVTVATRVRSEHSARHRSFSATTAISVEFGSRQTLGKCLEVVASLQQLLTVLTNRPAHIMRVGGHVDRGAGPCELYFNWPLPWGVKSDEQAPVFTSLNSTTSPSFGAVLERWIELQRTARAPISLLVDHIFRYGRNEIRYQDSAFLDLTRSLEGFDRFLVPTDAPVSSSGGGPDHGGSKPAERGQRGCQKKRGPSFRERVHATIMRTGPFGPLFLDDFDAFAKQAARTRNSYTHTSLSTPAVAGVRLAKMSGSLRVLLVAQLLRYLGYSDHEIATSFGRDSLYRYVKSDVG